MKELNHLDKREQLIYEKVERLVDSFIHSSEMTKHEFLRSVFDSAFELIPEAEKGSYFELSGNYYIPLGICRYTESHIKTPTVIGLMP